MTTATLSDHRVTRAKVHLPAWGCWFAEVSIDGEHSLSGQVTLKIADLTLVGTILSGGVEKGRSMYRLVAGKGGWGNTLRKKSYATDSGVKLANVLGDAAQEAGETLDSATVSTSTRVGPAFVRQTGPASRVLDQLADRAWYVGEDGITRLGARTAGTIPAKAARVKTADLARGVVVLASESIATILPGVTVDGITAVDVQHEVSAEGGLRSTLWGRRGAAGTSRGLEAFQKIFDSLDPDRAYRGVTEYRVVTRTGSRLNLQPVRVSTGMPDLARVSVRPGVAGCEADVALGSKVLVGFIECDPARPYVAAFEDAEGEGFVPDVLRFAGGANFVALANLVADELGDIATAFSTHTHAGVTTGGGTSGPPAVPPYSAGSVAATKVKAT